VHHRIKRTAKVAERQNVVPREGGREEYEYIKYKAVKREPYPIAGTQSERRCCLGTLLRTSHPVRAKSYASRNLVIIVIVIAIIVLFIVVTHSRVTQEDWSSSGTSSAHSHPMHEPLLLADR
jgi:hypothetical protein